MTDISDLKLFVRVVDEANLSAAGREMRMSPAVVSHRLQRLESDLGVRLLNRTTRRVHPTEEGNIYYTHCLRILDEFEKAEIALTETRESPSGLLKLSAPVPLGEKFIAPLLPEFINRYPDVDPRLHLSENIVNLVEDGYDLAIRAGHLEDSSLKARKLANDQRYICGSPDYLKKHGIPKTPEDLLNHNCLLLRFAGSKQFKWRLLIENTPQYLAVKGNLDTNNNKALTDWALNGHGLIMKSAWEISEYISSGALIPILEDFIPQDSIIAALYPQGKHIAPKLRVFIDFLVDKLQPKPPWI